MAGGTAEAYRARSPEHAVDNPDRSTLAGLGIEVNVDYVATTAIDLAGRGSCPSRSVQSSPPARTIGRRSPAGPRGGRASRGGGHHLLGLTVAVPGLIDRVRGVVVESPQPRLDRRRPRAEPARGAQPGRAESRWPSTTTPTVPPGPRACTAWPRASTTSSTSPAPSAWVPASSAAARCCAGRTAWPARWATSDWATTAITVPADARAAGKRWWAPGALEHATGPRVRPSEDPVSYAERLAEIPGHLPGARTGSVPCTGRGVAQLAATLDPAMIVLGGSFVPIGEATGAGGRGGAGGEASPGAGARSRSARSACTPPRWEPPWTPSTTCTPDGAPWCRPVGGVDVSAQAPRTAGPVRR